MKRYILFVVGNSASFSSDSLEEIKSMICLGDGWTIVDRKTGATKSNLNLTISTNLF